MAIYQSPNGTAICVVHPDTLTFGERIAEKLHEHVGWAVLAFVMSGVFTFGLLLVTGGIAR